MYNYRCLKKSVNFFCLTIPLDFLAAVLLTFRNSNSVNTLVWPLTVNRQTVNRDSSVFIVFSIHSCFDYSFGHAIVTAISRDRSFCSKTARFEDDTTEPVHEDRSDFAFDLIA